MILAPTILSRLAERLRALGRLRSKSYLNYTKIERLRLVFSHGSRRHEVNLLNFRVAYLSEEWFRYLLDEIFIAGEYFFEAATDSPVILDCGANIGLATLFFKHLYPKARISAFEADPIAAGILRRNVDQNHLSDVSTYNLMLCNTEGQHSFYVATNDAGSPLMSSMPNRLSNSREIKVKAGKLSHFVDGPVDLLKLDVEGAEFDVLTDLKCSGKLLQIQRMIIEYHHKIDNSASCLSDLLALLEDGGFEYQISGSCDPITRQNVFQDILIGAYRPLSSRVYCNC